jgi:hypothetical protein
LEAKKPTKQPLDAKLETNLDTTGSQLATWTSTPKLCKPTWE